MKAEFLVLKKNKRPELTTSMLIGCLSVFSDPRKKIHNLSVKGFLRPIKQGVYLVHENYTQIPYSNEVLAQLIYGPSYISLETALSNFGFIPERVDTITSVCLGRRKIFESSVGVFEFNKLNKFIYHLGVYLKEIDKNTFVLHATPEKALLDFVYFRIGIREFKKDHDFFKYVMESFRFDLQNISEQIQINKLILIADHYKQRKIKIFTNELARMLIK